MSAAPPPQPDFNDLLLPPALPGAAGPPSPPEAAPAAHPLPLQLDWSAHDAYGQGDAYAAVPRHGGGFGKAAALCIGSRQCQQARGGPDDKGVMCPSFRISQDDLHSTRGRAAALRAVLDTEADQVDLNEPTLQAAMDLCVACKGCKRECPNGVDMAALRAEVLAQRWRHQRPPRRTRWLATLPLWLPQARPWRALIAWRNRSPRLARWMERASGIAAARSLPVPAVRPFADGPAPAGPLPPPLRLQASAAAAASAAAQPAAGMAPAAAAREVVLLVDCFANHLEPGLARDALRVLHALGIAVHLVHGAPDQPLCCGRPAFSAGLIDQARGHAQRLLAALAPHLAAGRTVVGLEPSCLTMLRDEFQQLGLGPEAGALSRQALQLEEYLARTIDGRTLQPPWQALPRRVHVHGHCHQKAFGTLKAMRKLLGQIPQLQVQWIESSCCGMAGSFGYEAEHLAASQAMAELALLPAVRAAAPDDLILASGLSCRHQIEDGTGRQPLHLVQLLAQALPPG